MAIGADRKGLKTSVGSDGTRVVNPASDSSARKYVSVDSVSNPDISGESIANDQHLLNVAEVATSYFSVARAAAAAGRDNLAAARKQLAQGSTEDNGPSFSENFSSKISQLENGSISLKVSAQEVAQQSLGRVVASPPAGSALVKPPAVPQISHVEVDLDNRLGTIDSFFSAITFSIPKSKLTDGSIKAIRIFRSEFVDPDVRSRIGNISHLGLQRLQALSLRTHLVNQDVVSALQNRYDETNILNSISKLNPIDPLLGVRVELGQPAVGSHPSSSLANPLEIRDPRVADRLSSFVDVDSSGIDLSVASDPKSLRNIQLQNSDLKVSVTGSTIPVGKNAPQRGSLPLGQEQLRQRGDQISVSSGLVVNDSSRTGFKEIGFFTPNKLLVKVTGDVAEFLFVDRSITFGNSYKYYVSCVDPDLNEGTRSVLVQVDVDGRRPVVPPSHFTAGLINGFASLAARSSDPLVEKFEIYRREDDPGVSQVKMISKIPVISPNSGHILAHKQALIHPNGFIEIGEAVSDSHGGTTFFDRNVVQGRRYTYRIYSVDVFGNKSEAPAELSLFVPEPQSKRISLVPPNLELEVDSKTFFAKLTIRSDDPRVTALFLARRDLTLGQAAFTVPTAPNFIKLGRTNSARGNDVTEDARLYDQNFDSSWNGFIPSSPGSTLTFIDKNVQPDHVYQYSLYGLDRFGNKTSFAYSNRVKMVQRPLIDSPVNVRATLDVSGSTVRGVQVSWRDGNIDVSAEDMLGSRAKLQDSSVRTLFQVQRRREGSTTWETFPLTDKRSILDLLGNIGGERASFRPDFLELGSTYQYRVQAVQTGAFISNFSDAVSVFVGSDVAAPENFRSVPANQKIKPLKISLSWDMSNLLFVDRWELERAVVNNVAASHMNPSDPSQVAKLSFEALKQVYAESRRSLSAEKSESQAHSTTCQADDFDVELGNTYFYRVRSVDRDGRSSRWVYRAASLTDSIFEGKLASVLTDEEKNQLATSLSPMRTVFTDGQRSSKSFSLVPRNGRSR